MSNKNLEDALLLADLIIESKGNIGWAYNIQLSPYEKMGHFEKALEVGDQHIALIRSNSYEKRTIQTRLDTDGGVSDGSCTQKMAAK